MSKEESNRLIAEFMGGTVRQPDEQFEVEWIYFSAFNHCSINKLKYHSSWDWLMPVVEKIEQVLLIDYCTDDNKPGNPKVTIFGRCCDVHIRNAVEDAIVEVTAAPSKIEAVYAAIVLFIQWYNQQTKEQ